MSREFPKTKIDEALSLLDKLAQTKSRELNRLIGKKYSNIKEIFREGVLDQLKGNATKAMKMGEDSLLEMAQDIDKKVHDRPWSFIGGIAAGCLLLGYILRKS